jgi:radical SAM protein with 4Fe4S-binding SPASM domain
MRFRHAAVPRDFFLELLRSPDIVRGAIRTGVRRRFTAHLDFSLRDGYSAPPVQLDLKLTNACNLRCKMCGQWGETGWHLSQPVSFLRGTLPLDTYKRMIDDVSAWRPWIFVYGGEPFLYRDFLSLTAYMKERRFLVSVVTNGTLLEKAAADVVEQGWDFLMVSIDGPRETHDEIRGLKGSYEKAVAGLRAVHEERKRRGRRKPFTLIIGTFSQRNAGNLDQVFELAEELEVDGFVGYYGYFQTEESCRRHEQVMRTKLGTSPVSQRGWLWPAHEIDVPEMLRTLGRIRSRRWSFAHVFAPDLKDEDIPRFYSDHSRTFGYNRCVSPWLMTAVLANGDVAPCRDYPDYIVGNIEREKLTDMWNGDRLRKFRTVLKEETLLPVCTRCPGLMDM